MEGLINFSGTAFSNSKKTMVTVDFTTNCPKRRAGNPCPYCYVEVARRIKERKPKFYLAKKVYDYRAYNHELIKRKVFKNPETIIIVSGFLKTFLLISS